MVLAVSNTSEVRDALWQCRCAFVPLLQASLMEPRFKIRTFNIRTAQKHCGFACYSAKAIAQGVEAWFIWQPTRFKNPSAQLMRPLRQFKQEGEREEHPSLLKFEETSSKCYIVQVPYRGHCCAYWICFWKTIAPSSPRTIPDRQRATIVQQVTLSSWLPIPRRSNLETIHAKHIYVPRVFEIHKCQLFPNWIPFWGFCRRFSTFHPRLRNPHQNVVCTVLERRSSPIPFGNTPAHHCLPVSLQ